MQKETLKLLGFRKSHKENILLSNTSCQIRVLYNPKNPEESNIDYGREIVVHHKGVLNFKRPENIVVLECVLRLIKKGYAPGCIELEKTWKAGHGKSGRLDLFLRKDNEAFGMVECKTWGEEYHKERDKTLENGGQLFSYLVQEKATETIVLYTSRVEADGIKMKADAINTEDLVGNNQQEFHSSWDRSFISEGIFAETALPYNSAQRNIIKADLQELDRESGRGLFNSFAEILRRHVISDKSNAFNKIFNLFVCKIYDEDTRRPEDETDFQWKMNDTYESLIERLSRLYMHGLKDYLLIDITEEYFSAYSEFSFIDIYNKKSFDKNFTVIKEVVQLLEKYQIKYTSKQQFLGDFFEKLLNTGIKQEAGQYFTPIPLARFFLKSIPIQDIINTNIVNKSPHVLPFIIDYACGSGHFLTEAIDEVEEHIKNIDSSQLVGRIEKNFLAIKQNFYWAKDYIYGIEKDYRLAKTAKIAMFLNGDGDAIIINGDGLDDFAESTSFTGILKAIAETQDKTKTKTRDNPQFDVLISNPPFSIEGFRQYLVYGEDNFSLYPTLTHKSSEIECCFLERAQHLLKEGGYCGIIMPLSVLNSDNAVYCATRRKLLVEFELNAVVELGDKTFVATNTTTVGVFLRKRNKDHIRQALSSIYDHFVLTHEDQSIIDALAAFNESCPECEVNADEIKSFFETEQMDENEIKKHEPDSAIYPPSLIYVLIAALNRNAVVVVSYSGEKKEQEKFLGYRFSNRRGKEGIEYIRQNGSQITSLYDPDALDNCAKVNAHIRANFRGQVSDIDQTLKNHLTNKRILTLISGNRLCISNPSSLFEAISIESNCRFGDIIDGYPQSETSFALLLNGNKLAYHSGLIYNKETDEVPIKTNKRVLTASNIDLSTGSLVFDTKMIYLRDDFEFLEEIKPHKGDIIISNASGSLKHLGKVAYVEEDINNAVVGGFLSILRPIDATLGKALYYRLLSLKFRKYVASLRDQNINNLNFSELSRFSFTLPTNLEQFFDVVIKKEKQLKKMEADIVQLKR